MGGNTLKSAFVGPEVHNLFPHLHCRALGCVSRDPSQGSAAGTPANLENETENAPIPPRLNPQ
jgi:hypothetical protein